METNDKHSVEAAGYHHCSYCRSCEYSDLTVDFGNECPECGSKDIEETTPETQAKQATEYLLSQGLDPEEIKAEGMRRIAPMLERQRETAIRTRISNLPADSQERADGIVLLTMIDALRATPLSPPETT